MFATTVTTARAAAASALRSSATACSHAASGWRCMTSASSAMSDAFLASIPKTDLHVHLDGSVRVGTVIDLAQKQGMELPAYTEAGLREKVFRDKYESLEEYLAGFVYTSGVMQSYDTLKRVAYEFAVDSFADNVKYFEVRYAPQLHAGHEGLDMMAVMEAVNDGLAEATAEANASLGEGELKHNYGIIVCALRMFMPFFSAYYTQLAACMPQQTAEQVSAAASKALVHTAVQARDAGLPIVALDLAGAEAGFPAAVHKEAYGIATKSFLNRTVHAGESYGPESVKQAMADCNAQRIGHGYNIFNAHAAGDGVPKTEEYVQSLVEHAAHNRILMEVCLTSNEQTMPWLVDNLQDHTLSKMLAADVPASICTDNRLMSNTTITKELRRAVDSFDLTPEQLRTIVMAGFEHSFFPGTYSEKKAYVAAAAAAYDAVAAEHGL